MSEDKKPDAKIVSKKRVFDGFFKMDEYTIEMDKHDGGKQTLQRLIFERGHAVAILGYDPKRDEVLLVNEMRPALLANGEYPFSDMLPAGMIDKGETALEAAKREMLEETGLTLDNAAYIHEGAYVSSGGTSETLALVFGTVDMTKAGGVHGHPEEGESIKSVILTADEFIGRAESGDLKDMKTLVCAFWLAKNRERLQNLYGKAPDNAATRDKAQKPPRP